MPRLPQMTTHAQVERVERVAYILTTVGLGEIRSERLTHNQQGKLHLYQITDTGVLIVKTPEQQLITMFIASFDQILWFYQGQAPAWAKNKARKNERYRKGQPQ